VKKMLPLIIALGLVAMPPVFGQTDSPSPLSSPDVSPSPSKHKHPRKSAAADDTLAASDTTPVPGGGPGLVWVNTSSHVYHMEGSRWYGKTRHGKYMSEEDAISEGDHAAPGKSK